MNEIEIVGQIDVDQLNHTNVERFVASVLDRIGVEDWLMGLMFTDDEGIQNYNRQWRGIDSPTDVLSFVQNEGEEIPRMAGMPTEAGDVVVSLETVRRQARDENRPFEEELRRVIIHGLLHLNGMDHPGDDYQGGMLSLQEDLVGSIHFYTEE